MGFFTNNSSMFESSMGAIKRFFPNYTAYKATTKIGDEPIMVDGVKVIPNYKMNIVDSDMVPADVHGNVSKYQSIGRVFSSLSAASEDRGNYLKKVDSIKNYSLAEGIIRSVARDVLKKFYDKTMYPRFFDVRVNHPFISDELVNDFMDKFCLEILLKDYIYDLLWYGEYSFKIDWENIELDDFDNQKTSLAVYSRGRFKYIIIPKEDKKTGKSTYDAVTSGNYLTFKLFSTSYNTSFKDESGANYFVRLSRGIFSDAAISLMETLRLLESLIPVSEINSISTKSQYNLKLPIGTDIRSAYDKARKFEMMLKGLLRQESIPKDMNSLLDSITQIKVVPLLGDQQELTQQTFDKPQKIDLTYINDLRAQLANTTSVARSFILPDDTENKDNSKYLRLLDEIRNSLALSVKHVVYNYVKYILLPKTNISDAAYSDISFDQIEVITPKVQGLDELDTVEYSNLFSSTMTDITKMVEDIQELINRVTPGGDNQTVSCVDVEKLVTFINKKTAPLYGVEIFKVPDLSKKSSDDNPDDDRPDDSPSDDDNEFRDDNDQGDNPPEDSGSNPEEKEDKILPVDDKTEPDGVDVSKKDNKPEVDAGLLK